VGPPIYRQDALEIEWSRRSVFVQGHEVSLTQTEFELLKTLVQQAGKVMTHAHLLQVVWGPGYEHEMHLLRVTVSNLRRKIEPDPTRPHYILTEPGVGYRLRADGWTG
jgi:two-component system KDP operon response regulator KdpE